MTDEQLIYVANKLATCASKGNKLRIEFYFGDAKVPHEIVTGLLNEKILNEGKD